MCIVNKAKRIGISDDPFDTIHKNVEFGVYPAGFWSCFDPVLPHYAPIPPFWNGNVHSVLLYVRGMRSGS